jgi:hypothetical protein
VPFFVSNSSSGTSAFVGGALFRFVPFVVDSSLRFSSTLAPSISGTAILTLGRHTVVVILSPRAPQSAVDQETGSKTYNVYLYLYL